MGINKSLLESLLEMQADRGVIVAGATRALLRPQQMRRVIRYNPPERPASSELVDAAFAQAVRALGGGIREFGVLEQCGRIVLVQARRVQAGDPLFPVPLVDMPGKWWRKFRRLIRLGERISVGWANDKDFEKWEKGTRRIAAELKGVMTRKEAAYFYVQLWKVAGLPDGVMYGIGEW